jgi:MFS family permease
VILKPLVSTETSNRRNQFLILGFEFLWGIAVPFLLATTVMAGYLDSLGAPKMLVGAVPAVFFGGIAIVQPLSLALIPPGPKRYTRMLWAYRLGALGYTLMAILAICLPPNAYLPRIMTFFACYIFFVLVAGAGDPHYVKAVIESTPPEQRGIFFGYRMMAIGMGGLIGGEIVRRLLKAFPPPTNFGISILIGSLIIIVSTIWFGMFKPTITETIETRKKLGDYLGDVKRLVKGNKAFPRFLFVLFIVVAIQGCAAFVALSIRDRLGIGDSVLGRLGSIDALSAMVFAVILGKTGDKLGHKTAFIVGMLIYTCGLMVVMLTHNAIALQAGYLMVGAAGSVWVVTAINMGLDYSGGMETSRVYASINVSAVPFKLLGPIGAGAIVSRWGYGPMLITTASVAVLAILAAMSLPNTKKKTAQSE